MDHLTIAVVTETLVQHHYIKHAIADSGVHIENNFIVTEVIAANEADRPIAEAIDAWVVIVDVERLAEEQLEVQFQEWLYTLEKPVIFSEANNHNAAEHDFMSWTRQLKSKLLNLEGQIQLSTRSETKADYVWVLAASTGGPEAVKRFLDAVDDDLGVGFIYVQHIDSSQCETLAKKIARNSRYEASVASHGKVIGNNQVLVIPSENVVEIQPNGSLVSYKSTQWRGIYKPSIDQVVANVASVYGECSGVIFFTGMGEDGIAACRLMSLKGGQVWSQVVSDCVASSMPDEAIKTGCVNKIDSPENLALHLKKFIQHSSSEVVLS